MSSGKQVPGDQVQGEGNVEADRRYRNDVRVFVRDNDIQRAARGAEPASAAEAAALTAAERAGRARSKGDDRTDVMATEERDSADHNPR